MAHYDDIINEENKNQRVQKVLKAINLLESMNDKELNTALKILKSIDALIALKKLIKSD